MERPSIFRTDSPGFIWSTPRRRSPPAETAAQGGCDCGTVEIGFGWSEPGAIMAVATSRAQASLTLSRYAGGPLLIAGVLLAAGESTRFGRPKLLESWDGGTMVAGAVRSFLRGGLCPVVVVVPPGGAIRAALEGLEVQLVENPKPALGIGRSVACGVAALPPSSAAALIGVADQPLVDQRLIQALREAFLPGRIVVPIYGGHAGNPRIFDRRFFPELAALAGDIGGQKVASAHPEAIIEVRFDEQIGWDVDLPGDLERLATARPPGSA